MSEPQHLGEEVGILLPSGEKARSTGGMGHWAGEQDHGSSVLSWHLFQEAFWDLAGPGILGSHLDGELGRG